MNSNAKVRQAASFGIVGFFLLAVLILGIDENVTTKLPGFITSATDHTKPSKEQPDFGQFKHSATISANDLALEESGRRVIIVGDIHGMNKSIDALLSKLQYDSAHDFFIHTGDIIAKGPYEGSLAAVAYMAAHNVTGVRGNHDQKVIEWRAWIDWILNLKGGSEWLAEMERKTDKEFRIYADKWRGSGWQQIPEGWEMRGDHYNIARAMTDDQYAYLLSLPLVLHLPTLHTFIVHAGILPLDPHRSMLNLHQPLSHVPEPPKSNEGIASLRLIQERALLSDVPQNTDPWVLTNMRSIKHNNEVTKSNKNGTPWADLWNSVLERCRGFDGTLEIDNSTKADDLHGGKLPCHPSTVIYGHAASRGLDIKRWSMGLDSGCVYSRRLTALVIGSRRSSDTEVEAESIHYGERMKARFASVPCS